MFKAELRAAEVDPPFKICRDQDEPLRIKDTPPIFVRSLGNDSLFLQKIHGLVHSFFSVLFDCFAACYDADQMEIEIGDWRKKGWAEEGRWICALIGKVGNAGTDRAGTGKCRNKSKPASNFYTRTQHFRGTKHQKNPLKEKRILAVDN